MHKEVYRGCRIRVEVDEGTPDPLEDDNLGTIVTWHPRYLMGHVANGRPVGRRRTPAIPPPHDGAWGSPEDFREWYATRAGRGICLPVYMYDHGDVVLRLRPFDCPWDSRQLGYVFATERQLRHEHPEETGPWPRGADPPQAVVDWATRLLEAELAKYDAWGNGRCAFVATVGPGGEEIDACGGYIMSDDEDWDSGYHIDEARRAVDYWWDERAHFEMAQPGEH